MTPIRVLILEDHAPDAALMIDALRRSGFDPTWERVESEANFVARLNAGIDLILSDCGLPAFNGLQALQLVRSRRLDVPFILVSGAVAEDVAVEAMRSGADDYVLKDRLARLGEAARQALKRKRLRNEKAHAERMLAMLGGINSAIVRVRDGQRLLEEACRVAVEHGRFRMVTVGRLDPATLDVILVAWAGIGAELAAALRGSVRPESPDGEDTTARALRARAPVWDNDLAAAPAASPLRLLVANRGIRSMISLPLLVDGRAEHVFVLYADEPDFFTRGEVRVLEDIASNIAFALEHISRQRSIEKLSRIHALASGINSLVVRVRDRQELLDEACRIAVEYCEFGFAWIGTFDAERLEITPVASAGLPQDSVLRTSKLVVRPDRPQHGSVAARAIMERSLVYNNDITAGPDTGGERRREAIRRGYRSAIALPLIVNGDVFGSFSLNAKEPDFFDEDELKLLTGLARDISFALEHLAGKERLEYLSYYDALTGLPNRTLFIDRARQQMHARGGDPALVALILINLERFRNINETFGRQGGDELLASVARRLEHGFRGKDYLARAGADTFGVVIRGLRDAAAVAHALESQVYACFQQPFTIGGQEVRVAAKAGVALFPADGADADTLFRNAEAALKKARDSAERYLFYATEMNARAAQALTLETRLRKAVETQQFVLHYQPKISLASGAICGLEALMRWQEPGVGLVAPGMFIPVLEETGLILEAGRWALVRSLADYCAWTARGCTVPRIAVNVSAIQLQQKDLVDTVAGAVHQAGNIPHALELEITESLLMRDVEASIARLATLRGLGIHIAMDDFGTGYSSLSYIARLPISTLKIDRSFISGMQKNPQDMTIVSTIIALAHSLNLGVVAEGVETAEQAKLLALLKCDEAQGYYYGRPLPAPDIEPLLAAPAPSRAAPGLPSPGQPA